MNLDDAADIFTITIGHIVVARRLADNRRSLQIRRPPDYSGGRSISFSRTRSYSPADYPLERPAPLGPSGRLL